MQWNTMPLTIRIIFDLKENENYQAYIHKRTYLFPVSSWGKEIWTNNNTGRPLLHTFSKRILNGRLSKLLHCENCKLNQQNILIITIWKIKNSMMNGPKNQPISINIIKLGNKEIGQCIFLAGELGKTVQNNTKSDKMTKTSPLFIQHRIKNKQLVT